MTKWTVRAVAPLMVCGVVFAVGIFGRGRASDSPNTATLTSNPGEDLSDFYVFPSPTTSANVVLVMDVHPMIASGLGTATYFDQTKVFQFKIDTVGDGQEHEVIQVKFTGTGPTQTVQVAGPFVPHHPGTTNVLENFDSVQGTINTPFTTSKGIQVFAGARQDPFFFDLTQFGVIFPDRTSPITGVGDPTPNSPKSAAWSTTPTDAFKTKDVLSIVLELPRSML